MCYIETLLHKLIFHLDNLTQWFILIHHGDAQITTPIILELNVWID